MQKQIFIIAEWFICRDCGWLHLGYLSTHLEIKEKWNLLLVKKNKTEKQSNKKLVIQTALFPSLY